jgi:hypothetical protein
VNFQTAAIPRGRKKKKKKKPIGNSIWAFFRGKKKNLHKSPYVEKKEVTCFAIFKKRISKGHQNQARIGKN